MATSGAEAQGCFACGAEHPSGLRLVFGTDADARTAMAETIVAERFEGATGVVHGGIVATILDEAMVYASRTVAPLAATASLNVRYRRPVPTGQELRIEAQVTWSRHGAIGCRAAIRLGEAVLAQAEGVLVIMTAERGPQELG